MLLIVGLILAPMTGLRIWKVGPGEILLLVWSFGNINRVFKLKINNYNLAFWFTFISLIIFGTGFGIIRYPAQVVPSQIFTWFYLMFISIAVYSGLKSKEHSYLILILKRTAIYTVLWNFFLYIYSFIVSTNFLGAPIWYGSGTRYSGGATNPHQIALALGVYIIIILFFVKCSKKLLNKIGLLVLFFLALFLSFETRSSTLVLALFVSFMYLFFITLVSIDKSKLSKIVIFTFVLMSLLAIAVVFSNQIYTFIYGWVANDPNGLGRLEIYSTIIDSLNKNWIFGLGPGNHAGYGNYEYHNTYLEIVAMSGILGFAVYFLYSVKIFLVTKNNIYLQSVIILLYSYGLAGFAMRRLIFWGILMFITVITEKQREKSRADYVCNGGVK